MRSLPSSLLAAQKSASAVPYLRVVISDRIGGIRRLTFTRLYTGSEPDNFHALAIPSDGSVVRLRIEGTTLHRQRVAVADQTVGNAAWASWISFRSATRNCALTSYGANLLAFAVDDSLPNSIYWASSSDNGQSWSSWALLVSGEPNAIDYLAAASKSNGDTVLFWAYQGTVRRLKLTSGSWGSPATWSNVAYSIDGLACHYQGDWNLIVAGVITSGQDNYLWSMVYGDGFSQAPDTWSPLREMARASPGSNVFLRAPFLAQPDTFRLTFVEKYTGTQAYSRPLHSYSPASADFASNLWREPVPLNLSSDFGLALAASSSAAWLSAPYGVWRADLAVPSQEVTGDVLEAEAEDRPFGGRLRLVLRNDDGRYNNLPAAIKLGAEVGVSPGYVTSSGPQVSAGLTYWVQQVEHTSGGGQGTLVLLARDGWGLLQAWRARCQYAWAAGQKNVFQLLAFVLARAGLDLASVGASATASDLYPAFAIQPGETGLAAVRRLLALLPDVLYFSGGMALLKNPQATEATSYAYGTSHPLLQGRYGSALPEANRIQLFGDGIFQERFQWDSVESVYDRLLQVHDLNLISVTLANDRGDAELRRQALASTNGQIMVPVNCGQELYDVVEVTDAVAGLAAAKRRVFGLALRYVVGGSRPVYQQRLDLGGV